MLQCSILDTNDFFKFIINFFTIRYFLNFGSAATKIKFILMIF
jgi:hypothetical protein